MTRMRLGARARGQSQRDQINMTRYSCLKNGIGNPQRGVFIMTSMTLIRVEALQFVAVSMATHLQQFGTLV